MRVALCVAAVLVAACGSGVGIPCDVVLAPEGVRINRTFTKRICIDDLCREVEDSVQFSDGTTLLVAYGEEGSVESVVGALVPGFDEGALDGAERLTATIAQDETLWEWSGDVEGLIPAECEIRVIDVARA